MTITTDRLTLYPLTDDAMRQLIDSIEVPELQQAYSEMLAGAEADPENRCWYAVWLIELKDTGDTAGEFCFMGPVQEGMVEIGYGLRDGYCGYGYMTEAVKAVCQWALIQDGVERIESETAPDNEASQKVLLRSGFRPTGTDGAEGPRFVWEK